MYDTAAVGRTDGGHGTPSSSFDSDLKAGGKPDSGERTEGRLHTATGWDALVENICLCFIHIVLRFRSVTIGNLL